MDKRPFLPSEEEYQSVLKNVANARQVWGIDSSQFKTCLDVARCYLEALTNLQLEDSKDITTGMASLAITPSAAGDGAATAAQKHLYASFAAILTVAGTYVLEAAASFGLDLTYIEGLVLNATILAAAAVDRSHPSEASTEYII